MKIATVAFAALFGCLLLTGFTCRKSCKCESKSPSCEENYTPVTEQTDVTATADMSTMDAAQTATPATDEK